ncbi:hypothetical protein tb265_11930 [Gemmatimonadetes bacterium T265]|nr:hypothetical protein tb265_11930 [Gemmatimonadetes bacterium T265]
MRPPPLSLPSPSLVLLVGTSGSGKSTFARAHFGPYETVSSDECRGVVSNDPNDQACTPDAFALLHHVVGLRLGRGLLTVVDATNVQAEARRPLLALARQHHLPAVAVVLDLPESVCQARNRARADRVLDPRAIHKQHGFLRRSLPALAREGFGAVHVLRSEAEIAGAVISREPLPPDRRGDHGPFDVVGDVHGCADELEALLALLGYAPDGDADADGVRAWRHPAGRRVSFLGDLVDRGPRTPDVLRIAIGMVAAGTALAVPGNHDAKLLRALRGHLVHRTHGLEQSLEQLDAATPGLRARTAAFLDGLPSHYVLDGGRLVVAHAGMPAELQGRDAGAVRAFALYGGATGATDELGLPVRGAWAAAYRGRAAVVYGHTPVAEPAWVHDTIDVDTGCVFGGRLTALRWPERGLVSVPALRQYAEPRRPFR